MRDHKDWRADLLDRLGPYCCYCNIRLPESPQVEHVTAQVLASGQALDWDNLLLACGACNSRKNALPCTPTTHFLPHAHNTHLAFAYQTIPHPVQPGKLAAVVVVRPGLSAAQHTKALATIELCQLANIPTDNRRLAQAIDLRWKYRQEELLEAGLYRNHWDAVDATGQQLLLDSIERLARKGGFFSVWFAAFHDVPAVKQALLAAFPGTAACFPAPAYDPVERISGDL